MEKQKSFTLAEVLITLGIIGLVAEMTLPNLIQSFQKVVYVTSLKKAYTEFNQVLKQMSADKGCVDDLKCSGLFATGTTAQTFGDEFVKYVKVVKNCGMTTGQNCWSDSTNFDWDGKSANYYYINNRSDHYKFITADGMSISITRVGVDDCGSNSSSGALGYMSQVCGQMFFDINGSKEPNDPGRDVFTFFITNGKGALLYPYAGKDHVGYWWNYNAINYCSASNPDKTGWFCSGRITENGWVMDY